MAGLEKIYRDRSVFESDGCEKKLGHTISVESIPGEGSSFKIDLSSYDLQVE